MPLLQVIVASTRPGRVGLPVAAWFAAAAVEHGAFDVELVDLAEHDLPLMDEPNHPRLKKYTKAHTLRWSETVDRADAFVIVLPEYNHSFNAAIKNAIDFLHQEWADKPVAFVSYGGISGGLRAAHALREVAATMRMVPIVEGVPIPLVGTYLNDDGEFVPSEVIAAGAAPMFAELARVQGALAPLRSRV